MTNLLDVYGLARERIEDFLADDRPSASWQEAFCRFYPADQFRTPFPSEALEVE